MIINKNLKKIIISSMALLMISSIGTLTSSKLVSAKHINSTRVRPNYYKSGQKLATKSMLLSLISSDPKRERKNLTTLANNKYINNYSFDLGFLQSISSRDYKLIKHNKISDPYYTKMVYDMNAYYMVKASQAYKKANNHNKKVIMNVICGDEIKGIAKYDTKSNLRIFNRLTHSNFNEYEKAASGSDLLEMAEDSTDSASLPHEMVKHNMAKAKRMRQKGYRLLNQVKPYYNKEIKRFDKQSITIRKDRKAIKRTPKYTKKEGYKLGQKDASKLLNSLEIDGKTTTLDRRDALNHQYMKGFYDALRNGGSSDMKGVNRKYASHIIQSLRARSLSHNKIFNHGWDDYMNFYSITKNGYVNPHYKRNKTYRNGWITGDQLFNSGYTYKDAIKNYYKATTHNV